MRDHIDFAGRTLVDPAFHQKAGPVSPSAATARDEFDEHVAPTLEDLGSYPSTGTANSPSFTWRLRPYFPVAVASPSPLYYPALAGWAESTAHDLFHAGGLGALAAATHALMHPVAGEPHPLTATALDPRGRSFDDYIPPRARPVKFFDDVAKTAFIDFLLCNARTVDELAHRSDNDSDLALSLFNHAGAFQYRRAHPLSREPLEDHLAHYFLGLGQLVGSFTLTPWDDQHVQHAARWWSDNSLLLRDAFERHLVAIKDPVVRAHVATNFHERADTLDRFCHAFGATPKFELYSPYGAKGPAYALAATTLKPHEPVYPWHESFQAE